MLAPSYIVSVIAVVAQVLPLLGINVVAEDLQTTVNTIIAISAGLVVIYRQLSTGRSTIVGGKPS